MKLARRQFLQLAGSGLALAATGAFAQSYPSRPVRIIVPVAAGGPNDVSARMVAQKLTEVWGHNVLIENMPGGSENIGMGAAARSKPDGYTLLFAAGAFTANPVLYAKIPYDPIKDFAPVTLLASGPHVLSVHPSFPANTVQELVDVVKANPGKYTFASSGAATQVRMVGELFKLKHGLDLVHVPFNGGGPAINSAVGGHTPIIVTSLSAAATVIRGGQLRGPRGHRQAALAGGARRADHGRDRQSGAGGGLDAGHPRARGDAAGDHRCSGIARSRASRPCRT